MPKTADTEKRDDAARVHVELGQRYLQQGRLEMALEKLQKALQINPNYADAHTVIGLLYERIGDPKSAEEHYRRAVELQPKAGAANNNYGQILCSAGRLDEADKYFQRAVADPFYKYADTALANAGGCALQIGQRERGVRDLRKALALQPDNAYALEAMARDEAAQTRFFEARAFSERRLSAAPATASVLQLAIQIEQGLGDMAAAGRYQQRLRKEFPDAATTTPGASAL
jgi:type IV pilus assembly protein PilF